MDLAEQLHEYQIGKEKPLGVRPFRPSKEEDWYLYAVHDEQYLKLKYGGGEKGEKLPYKWQDIVVPDDYDCEIAFIRAKSHLEHTSVNMATRLQNGESGLSLILQGENVYTVNAIMKALSVTDYQRLAEEYNELQTYVEKLLKTLRQNGIKAETNSNGEIVLKRFDTETPTADSETGRRRSGKDTL